MIELSITVNGEQEIRQSFDDLVVNQVPYAMARALTKTAQDRQKLVQDSLGDGRFILRQPTFVKRGVRIEPATKQNLEAKLKDIDWFMVLQETGGEKVAHGGHSYIAVPLSGARPSPQSNIRDADRPAALMKSGDAFIKQNSEGVPILWKAVERHAKRSRRGPGAMRFKGTIRTLLPMYALVTEATVKPRYGFKETAMTGIEQNFKDNFAAAYAEAVRTAKK